jgi:hypothetical protein
LGSNRKLWIDRDATIWKIHLTLSFPSIFQVVASLLIRNFLIIATIPTLVQTVQGFGQFENMYLLWLEYFRLSKLFNILAMSLPGALRGDAFLWKKQRLVVWWHRSIDAV